MEQSWFPPKESSGPPETRVCLVNQRGEVKWREQQHKSRGLEKSYGQMWSCQEGQEFINIG